MKKIFYLMFFALLFVINFNYVFAENSTAHCVYDNVIFDNEAWEGTQIIIDVDYDPSSQNGTINVKWNDEIYSPELHAGSNLSLTNFTIDDGKKLECPVVLYTALNAFSTHLNVYSTPYLTEDKNSYVDNLDFSDAFFGSLWWQPKLNEEESFVVNQNITEILDDTINCVYTPQFSPEDIVYAKLNKTKKTFVMQSFYDKSVMDTFSFPSIEYDESINECPKIVYARCNVNGGKCSSVGFTKDLPSHLLWPILTFEFKDDDVKDADDIEEEYKQSIGFTIDGGRYKELLQQLRPPLEALNSSAIYYNLTVDGTNSSLSKFTSDYTLCSSSECSKQSEYYTEQGLKNIRTYCNNVYDSYPKYKGNSDMDLRMKECMSFNTFYQELVKNGIVNDLGDGCGILPDELVDKLEFILDLIKIAGPLIALGLGTLDFIKVIANGDADKEMKTAFKRFMTRLIAAALLFIIPIILAFLLDIFLGSEEGYDSDNPFCNVVDWEE